MRKTFIYALLREAWRSAIHGVTKSGMTEWLNWTGNSGYMKRFFPPLYVQHCIIHSKKIRPQCLYHVKQKSPAKPGLLISVLSHWDLLERGTDLPPPPWSPPETEQISGVGVFFPPPRSEPIPNLWFSSVTNGFEFGSEHLWTGLQPVYRWAIWKAHSFFPGRGVKPHFVTALKKIVSCSVTSNSLWSPWTVVCQAHLSMGFSRQEYWNR